VHLADGHLTAGNAAVSRWRGERVGEGGGDGEGGKKSQGDGLQAEGEGTRGGEDKGGGGGEGCVCHLVLFRNGQAHILKSTLSKWFYIICFFLYVFFIYNMSHVCCGGFPVHKSSCIPPHILYNVCAHIGWLCGTYLLIYYTCIYDLTYCT
jgi:hypothetical protein